MTAFYARRIRFENGERCSVLQRVGGLPVHEVTLFLDGMRIRNRASATLHNACKAVAVLYEEMDAAGINLIERFEKGEFLSMRELTRVSHAVRVFKASHDPDEIDFKACNVVSIRSVQPRRTKFEVEALVVGQETVASRLRYIAKFLEFLSRYVRQDLSKDLARELDRATQTGLNTLNALTPSVSKKNALGQREGLSRDEQEKLEDVVHPASHLNPWEREYVRHRNHIIVKLLLATGMRQGELLGLRIADFSPQTQKIKILRRPDKKDDFRKVEPNVKTLEREVALSPSMSKLLSQYITVHRQSIKAARKWPQIFVSEEGQPLTGSSIEKMFQRLRSTLPECSVKLTCHVMRHTWNERFSEYADEAGITDAEEGRARADQQGWSSPNSARFYLRRHTRKKAHEMSLEMQKQLEEKINN